MLEYPYDQQLLTTFGGLAAWTEQRGQRAGDELYSGVCHPPGDDLAAGAASTSGLQPGSQLIKRLSDFYCLMGMRHPGVFMDLQTSARSNPPLED